MNKENLIADVTCPQCNHVQKHEFIKVINVSQNPQLKLGVLTDSLFTMKCEECGNEIFLNNELLYTDEDADLTILVAPEIETMDVSKQKLESNTSTNRIVQTVVDLKEKVVMFDTGLDDRAVELVKMYVENTSHNQFHGLRFLKLSENGDLIFALPDMGEEYDGKVMNFEYKYYLQLLTLCGGEAEDDAYYLIDPNWAYTLLKKVSEENSKKEEEAPSEK